MRKRMTLHIDQGIIDRAKNANLDCSISELIQKYLNYVSSVCIEVRWGWCVVGKDNKPISVLYEDRKNAELELKALQPVPGIVAEPEKCGSKKRLNVSLEPDVFEKVQERTPNMSASIEYFLENFSREGMEVKQGWCVVDTRSNRSISQLFQTKEDANKELRMRL